MIADEPVFCRYIKRYEQHHRALADYRNGDTYDGMAIQWYDRFADFMDLIGTPEYTAKMQPDETRILDPAGLVILFTEEAEVFIVVSRQPMTDVVHGDDGVARCWWCGDDPLYVAYHDLEWGRPLRDERALFELLCLEGFQAGLAWITILRKRAAFREAFDGFDVAAVARFAEPDVERLLADPGIVRHRGKITATIGNAQAVEAMHDGGHLAHAGRLDPRAASADPSGRPTAPSIPASTPTSETLAKVLRVVGDALRRPHHRLRLHAVRRPRRRPPRRLRLGGGRRRRPPLGTPWRRPGGAPTPALNDGRLARDVDSDRPRGGRLRDAVTPGGDVVGPGDRGTRSPRPRPLLLAPARLAGRARGAGDVGPRRTR